MDKINKALKKLAIEEKEIVFSILSLISSGKTQNLDVKKLKGRQDIFRIRKGNIRIIYRIDKSGKIFILAIERRKENTYKLSG